MDTRWKDHVLEWRVWQSYIKYQNQIKNISCSDKEINDGKEINTELVKFYKALFQPKINVSNALIQDHLNRIEIQNWLSNHKNLKALLLHTNFGSFKKMTVNDGMTKEFYEALWDDLKTLLLSVSM